MKIRIITGLLMIVAIVALISFKFILIPCLIILLLLWWEIGQRPINGWSLLAFLQCLSIVAVYDLAQREIFFITAVVVINDSAAYFGGKYFNPPMWQNPIFPKTSPKKTWGGFIYGVAFATFGAVLFNAIWPVTKNAAFTGSIVAFLAVAGDWLESKFKRSHNIKDSGDGLFTARLLSGHGGMYDRFDAATMAVWGWIIFF